MAKDFRYDIVDGQIVVTDGTSTEVLAQFFAGKRSAASTQEEGAMLGKQAATVEHASARKFEDDAVQGM